MLSSAPRSPGRTGGSETPSGSGTLTLSLSAIIAAIWTGIVGFDWAASHLDGAALLASILFALLLGTALTVYLVERTIGNRAGAAPVASNDLRSRGTTPSGSSGPSPSESAPWREEHPVRPT